jgi:hypothetical protein
MDFRGLAACIIGNGRSVCFWEDIWNGSLLKLEYPQLFSYTRDPKVSVKTFMSQDVADNFLPPLSMEASRNSKA